MPREVQEDPGAGQRLLLAAIIDGASAGTLLDATAERGLQVYRQAYLARLREALADNYSVFARALGDEAFAQLADAYAGAHPPTGFSVRSHGEHLDGFLADEPCDGDGTPLLRHPALRDLARMDRALRDAFDAPDAPVLTAAALAAVPAADWPALPLRLLPSARRITLEWAVEAAWHAIDAAPPGQEPELPEPHPLTHSLLVWRPDLGNRWRSLDPVEDALLATLESGTTLAALCGQLGTLHADPAQAGAAANHYLHQWLADGCLAG
ncbi:MAG: putative DNA-binding domain-containing protein [Pseudomonadota bacterium]|nr:putative DNA-binding domain-containing protein [Pseudomonadota bacterium]